MVIEDRPWLGLVTCLPKSGKSFESLFGEGWQCKPCHHCEEGNHNAFDFVTRRPLSPSCGSKYNDDSRGITRPAPTRASLLADKDTLETRLVRPLVVAVVFLFLGSAFEGSAPRDGIDNFPLNCAILWSKILLLLLSSSSQCFFSKDRVQTLDLGHLGVLSLDG